MHGLSRCLQPCCVCRAPAPVKPLSGSILPTDPAPSPVLPSARWTTLHQPLGHSHFACLCFSLQPCNFKVIVLSGPLCWVSDPREPLLDSRNDTKKGRGGCYGHSGWVAPDDGGLDWLRGGGRLGLHQSFPLQGIRCRQRCIVWAGVGKGSDVRQRVPRPLPGES